MDVSLCIVTSIIRIDFYLSSRVSYKLLAFNKGKFYIFIFSTFSQDHIELGKGAWTTKAFRKLKAISCVDRVVRTAEVDLVQDTKNWKNPCMSSPCLVQTKIIFTCILLSPELTRQV